MDTKCCEMPKVHDDCHASVSQTASLRIPVPLLPLIPSVSNLRIAACKSSELSLESDRLKVADRTDVTKEANRGGEASKIKCIKQLVDSESHGSEIASQRTQGSKPSGQHRCP